MPSGQPTPQPIQSPQKPSGGIGDLGALLAEMKLSSTELLLIVLIVYFLNSHADDEMAVLLLILLGLGL